MSGCRFSDKLTKNKRNWSGFYLNWSKIHHNLTIDNNRRKIIDGAIYSDTSYGKCFNLPNIVLLEIYNNSSNYSNNWS